MLKSVIIITLILLLSSTLVYAEDITLYFSPTYHKEIISGEETEIKYYPLPGATAMRKGDKLYFIHPDHIGSTSVVTDGNGEEQSSGEYYPYGSEKESEGEIPTERKYTGQILDDSTDLYFYNARYYNPYVGAFISADTVEGPNRYAYADNNPVVYNDPSGTQSLPMIMKGTNKKPGTKMFPEISKIASSQALKFNYPTNYLYSPISGSSRYYSVYEGVAGREIKYVSYNENKKGVIFPPYYYTIENPKQIIRAYPPEDQKLKEQLRYVLTHHTGHYKVNIDEETGLMSIPEDSSTEEVEKYLWEITWNMNKIFRWEHFPLNVPEPLWENRVIPNLGNIMETFPVCFEFAVFTHLALAELGIESFLTGVPNVHADVQIFINGKTYFFSSGRLFNADNYEFANDARLPLTQLVQPENAVN